MIFEYVMNKIGYYKWNDEAGRKTKEVNQRLNEELADTSTRLQRGYPKNRELLKEHLGKTITLTAVLGCQKDRSILAMRVKYGKEKATDHLWVNTDQKMPNHWFYRIVSITGKVSKYGTISYREDIKDKYCLTDVVIEKAY